MTIEEYKKKLIDIVEEMEKEHGMDVTSVQIEISIKSITHGYKCFEVKINA